MTYIDVKTLFLAALSLSLIANIGCRKASFGVVGGDLGSLGGPIVPVPNQSVTETFSSSAAAGRVDILFVDDNSSSMEVEQANLGDKFSSFAAAITGLNWQVGITTTDCSAGPFGICGDLLPLSGASGTILRPSTANFLTVFKNTIVRNETLACAGGGVCPSGDEEPLRATMTAMQKRNGANTGFFRANSSLAVVILSDEDEMSNRPAQATKPGEVVSQFQAIWGTARSFKVYAITVLSGDTSCLQTQQNQSGSNGSYGTASIALANMTGGMTESICSPNYDALLTRIGNDVQQTVMDSIVLSHDPIPTTVQVKLTPSYPIGWKLKGREIEFQAPVPSGTAIEVTYDYL